MKSLLLFLGLFLPERDIWVEYVVPIVEINHVYNPDTKELRFTQLILWDKYDGLMAHHVVGHCMTSNNHISIQKKDKEYVIIINNFCKIKTEKVRVTSTYVDREEQDRRWVPIEERRKFRYVKPF